MVQSTASPRPVNSPAEPARLTRFVVSEFGLVYQLDLSPTPEWHVYVGDRLIAAWNTRKLAEDERRWQQRRRYRGHKLRIVQTHWVMTEHPPVGVLANPAIYYKGIPTPEELDAEVPTWLEFRGESDY